MDKTKIREKSSERLSAVVRSELAWNKWPEDLPVRKGQYFVRQPKSEYLLTDIYFIANFNGKYFYIQEGKEMLNITHWSHVPNLPIH